ncbi:MAG: protein-disulfide reductase DsbD [Cellvibrionaceae bacterium]|nr:protein-disulfide reductase DsbD [Cellvibrionaceae bacterium]
MRFLSLTLAPLALLLALASTTTAIAQSFTALLEAIEEADTSLESAIATETFLPVEQAYQLMVLAKEDQLVLDWVIADNYFLYGEQFRASANGQTLALSVPQGLIKYDPIFEKDVEKHYRHIEISIPKNQLPTTDKVALAVTSQGCADAGLCYPPHTQHFLLENQATRISAISKADTRVINNTGATVDAFTATPTTASTTPAARTTKASAITMLLFALLGGLILNLMPCVLPVLSLKALSLSSGQDLQQQKRHGWSYSLGVITTFVAVAGVLLAARAAGQAIGWGFQLQSPGFVTLLIYLFFVMGLALSGYITLGNRWMHVGQQLTQGHALKHSYFTGALAAVVASPCTAPFMASALGYAMGQPGWLALSIFATLGLGMALPFLLLSHLPQLSRFLPKPGAWMETFKQALAFPLYLTAVWLLWVLGRQLGHNAVILVLLGALTLVFIYWIGHRKPPTVKWAGPLGLILVLLISGLNTLSAPITPSTATREPTWEPYSEQRLTQLRQQGKAVFINMTADWCLTCLANEKLVLTDGRLEAMKAKGIHLLKGDWTNYDPAITQFLETYQRNGVPLYVLFSSNPQAPAKVLPQILTPKSLKAALSDS